MNRQWYLWRFWFTDTQCFTEIRVDSIVCLALSFWRFDPVTDARYLLFLTVVFPLELVDALGVVECKCTESALPECTEFLLQFFSLLNRHIQHGYAQMLH